MSNSPENQTKRTYPPIYEKILPYAMGGIGLAILLLIILSVLVVLGVFPLAR